MTGFEKITHLCDTCNNYIVQTGQREDKGELIVTKQCRLTLDCTPKMLECSEYEDANPEPEKKELLSTRNQQRRAYWQGTI